jgi:serine/threonine protein kinase/sugar lactone lactonase YvrE
VPVIDRARIAEALPGVELGLELGSGVFGMVLTALQPELAREVVVKVLDSAGSDTAALAETLVRLTHPHLARTYSVVTAGQLCLVVGELLPGGSLASRRDLSGPAACAAALAVGYGLAAAHVAGVTHGNVTPANILLTSLGQPKLTDLGTVALAEPPQVAVGIAGTPQYLAPEQITGAEVGPPADVYALAATLYEWLAGEPVFGAGLTAPERLRNHCEVVPPPAAGARPAVAALLARALAKEPGDRPGDGGAFASELAQAAREDYGSDWLAPYGSPVALPGAARERTIPPTGPRQQVTATITRVSVDAGPLPADATTRLPASTGTTSLVGDASTSLAPAAVASVPPSTPPAATPPAASTPPASTPRPRGRRLPRTLVPVLAGVAAALVAAAVVAPLRLTSQGAAAVAPGSPGPSAPPTPVYASGTAQAPPASPRVKEVVLAGTGKAGYSGDGGQATAAELKSPFGAVTDAAGDIYVDDDGNNVVRKISPNNTITTVAGNGIAGFSGDGGPATAAELNGPVGLAVDAAGNVYIADYLNSRIRRVSPSGIITTIAGNGEDENGPGAVVGTVAQPATPDFGDGGPAIDAFLFAPAGLALDHAGDLLIADTVDNRIRMINPQGIISTVAGGYGQGSAGDGGPATSALLDEPWDVAVDGAGRIYIADELGQRVRRIDLDGTIETIAGVGIAGFSGDGGPAIAATLRSPRGVAVDAAGDVFITDRSNRRIREITATGTIRTVAGTLAPGTTGAGLIPDGPVSVDAAGRILIVADRGHNRVLRITLDS